MFPTSEGANWQKRHGASQGVPAGQVDTGGARAAVVAGLGLRTGSRLGGHTAGSFRQERDGIPCGSFPRVSDDPKIQWGVVHFSRRPPGRTAGAPAIGGRRTKPVLSIVAAPAAGRPPPCLTIGRRCIKLHSGWDRAQKLHISENRRASSGRDVQMMIACFSCHLIIPVEIVS